MLWILNCIAERHDLRLVAISALICVLGCYTTAVLLARADEVGRRRARPCLFGAAGVFGSSVWSLHFVAMLAFMPAQLMACRVGLTALAAVVASAGAFAAFSIRTGRTPGRTLASGVLLGSAVSGMHYVDVAAASFSGLLSFDRGGVAASLAIAAAFSTVAMARAPGSGGRAGRVEVAGWLALAACGLHFTGMAAITASPGAGGAAGEAVFGTAALALAVGGISAAVLVSSLAAVTVERHLSRRTLQELTRVRLMGDLAQEVLLIHRDGTLVEVNSAGERLIGAPAGALRGRPVSSLFAAESAPVLLRRTSCRAPERQAEEVEVCAIGGARVVVEISCQPIDYVGGPATAVTLRDLTARKRDEARIRHLARHDALTDLPNRYTLQERLALALDAAERRGGTLAVICIDLDRFKPVNDLHGHAAGDALLVEVSRRISAEVRADDTLARVGGDEFVLVLASPPGPGDVFAVASRVLEALHRPFEIGGKRAEVGASIGVALYPRDGADADALMRAADAALYQAKDDGRGAVRFHEPAMDVKVRARLQLERELTGAVERGEMRLHYQPIVDGLTGEVDAFEALVRWAHPARGLVLPAEFIPLAEETGLIDGIGRWAIQRACRDAAAWPAAWRVAVNVSPKQFRRANICEVIDASLRCGGLEPARLVVEVTEGALIEGAARASATLNRLRALGVRVALDDFGTGCSSLSHIQSLKFDAFKVDASFVQRLGADEAALTLTRAIVNLGHDLGVQVTAEGVETPAQLAILRALGCDRVQGNLVARPAPVASLAGLDRLRALALFGRAPALLSA